MRRILSIVILQAGFLLSDSLIVRTLSQLSLPTFAYEVWVKDTFAYVVGDTGLIVINVSLPTNPYIVTIYEPGKGRGIFIRDTFAYIAQIEGYVVIDNIRDPSNPFEVGRCSTGTKNLDIYIQGNFAYVAGWKGGIRIIDISDPANPFQVGFNDTLHAEDLCVLGDYVYVVAPETLSIYKVTDPSNPVLIYAEYVYGGPDFPAITGWSNYIAISLPGIEYLTGGCLYIYDVSNPYNPQRIYELWGDTLVPWFYDIAVLEEENLLVTNGDYPPGWTWDISDPSNPIRVGKGSRGIEGLFVKPGYFYGGWGHYLVIRSYEWVNVKEKNIVNPSESLEVIPHQNNKIKIFYSLPSENHFIIRLLNSSGKLLKILKTGFDKKGEFFVTIKDYPSGIYFIELVYKNKSIKKKINIIK